MSSQAVPPLPRTPGGPHHFFKAYTDGLTTVELERLFTRETPEAYRFFSRHIDHSELKKLPWHRRILAYARVFFLAFTMKLTPARRLIYAAALACIFIGLIGLYREMHVFVLPHPAFAPGTMWVLSGFLLVNFLVFVEVADRLTLKNDLEIARDIQQAMLPSGVYSAPCVETVGISRPANTVGGDFYDILPLDDGRLVITVGDVAGKGSPAALLMALLLAMLRTLVDERLEPADLITRLNKQVCRHAPGTRFITLFYAVYQPLTGELTYVSAGHMPPLVMRRGGTCERLTDGGIALGMFEHSTYSTGNVVLQADDLLAVYSDGITEAENPTGTPFDEVGLETALKASALETLPGVGAAVVQSVERHTAEKRFADDLTILLLRRTAAAAAGV